MVRSVKNLQQNTLNLLYKLSVRSLIDYGIVVFGPNLKNSDLDRLEQIQYRAAKICTGALHISSKEKVNEKLGWTSIKTRADFLGLCVFHKIHKCETRPLILSCMTQFNLKLNSTKFGTYKLHPNLGATFWKSFFPYFTKRWNSLSCNTRNLSLLDFKSKLKYEFTPQKRRHFAYGSM